MTPKTMKRCEQLSAEARKTCNRWISEFADDYGGRVKFALALASAILALREITPGLQNTGQDFLSAVKAGTVIWVEEGEKP